MGDLSLTRCKCPCWAHGRINGSKPGRWPLNTRSLSEAERQRDRLTTPGSAVPVPVKKKTDNPADSGVSVDAAVRDFIASRRTGNCSAQTIRDYTYCLEDFGEFARNKGPLGEITEADVFAWVDGDGGYTVRTANTRRSRVSALFKWAAENRLISESPIKRKRRAPRGHARAPFSNEEVGRMLAILPEAAPRARALFLLMLNTGMRIADAVFLRRDALNFSTRLLTFRTIKSQNRTVITMELNAEACDAIRAADASGCGSRHFFFLPEADYTRALQAINDEGDFLEALPFRSQAPLQAARIALKGIFRRAGIPKSERKPHRLRSTFAVACLRGGVDIFVLKELLGHSSVQVTEKAYTAILQEHRSQIAQATRAINFSAMAPRIIAA